MKIIVPILLSISLFIFSSCKSGNEIVTENISSNSPIGVLKTFTDAKNKKDAETMKQTLSKNTLETISDVARGNKLTLNEYLKKGNTTPLNNPAMPQTRNEKIENEVATIEIKRSSSDSWRKLTFVKENDIWKMDLVKFLEELYPSMKK